MTSRDLAIVAHQLSKKGVILICSGTDLDPNVARPEFVSIHIKDEDEDSRDYTHNEIIVNPKEMAQAIEDIINKL